MRAASQGGRRRPKDLVSAVSQIHFTLDDLARTRFAISPIWELTT